ncbi:carbon-nitrogen hydrolase family protein [Thermoanaerobacter sp. YS13]|uniref:carbon-nitrogen hydrolase family protein n=1 Tax=Thermoanaerobacter sp. YS13 TaxID=1511746 RepID=UPI00068E8516|nr:carbon-nitrogen hydrolase family protein [Thermoanaerobacter sp. YS13]
MRELTIGIVQFGATQEKKENLEKIKKLTGRRKYAEIVVIPEYSNYHFVGLSPEKSYELAEPLEGSFITSLQEIALSHKIYLIGAFLEKSFFSPKVYNTAFLISPEGKLIGTYRKIHLFDAYNYKESDYVVAGNESSKVYDIGKVKIALSVCFDLRFPELYRVLALEGAEMFIMPTAWYSGPLKEETLSLLIRARAVENTSYMVVACQFNKTFTGRSSVIDPFGTVLTDLSIGEKYSEISIDLDLVEEARKIIPVLFLRKPEIYCPKICGHYQVL